MLRTIRLQSCRLSSPAHRLSKRTYSVSVSSDAEAFLRPAGSSHPGVTYLSLNRPKTKNAISVNLLQVRGPHTYMHLRYTLRIQSLRFGWYSNSGTVWNGSASTRSEFTLPRIRAPPSTRETLQLVLHQNPRSHRELDVRERLLFRGGLDRTEINDQTSSRQVPHRPPERVQRS